MLEAPDLSFEISFQVVFFIPALVNLKTRFPPAEGPPDLEKKLEPQCHQWGINQGFRPNQHGYGSEGSNIWCYDMNRGMNEDTHMYIYIHIYKSVCVYSQVQASLMRYSTRKMRCLAVEIASPVVVLSKSWSWGSLYLDVNISLCVVHHYFTTKSADVEDRKRTPI